MKTILLIISILLFVLRDTTVAGSEKRYDVRINDINKKEQTLQSNKSIQSTCDTLIEQEINYYAPQSALVYLVWKTDRYPLKVSVSWNKSTKLIDGLLYIPMAAHGDTFTIRLHMPIGSTFQYSFWITKNKQGQYQDFWDLQSSDKATVTVATPINKKAIYSKDKKKNVSPIQSKSWLLLLLLISIYIPIQWCQKKWGDQIPAPSIMGNILILGFSLTIFHAIARAQIIGVNLKNIFHDSTVIAKVVRGSVSDFIFVSVLVLVFMLALRWITNDKIKRIVYGIFLFLAMFSTLVACTNITTVIFLGKPFTYQWLYYSDFLGSNEAKMALLENLSLSIVCNMMAFCLSMFFLSGVLRSIYRLLAVKKQLRYITLSLFGLGMAVIVVKASTINSTWTKGQSENAITCMAYSLLTANSNSSFFSAHIPDTMEPIDPTQSTKSKSFFLSLNNRHVKNVLFIVLESAGASYFDGYGGNFHLSPNLNKYASQALFFDQMYAHAPSTDRSLVSILGSMYPYLSYKSLTQEIPELDHPTLASVLKKQGYRTSFFSSADLRFQRCNQFLANRGFDCVEDFSAIKSNEKFQFDGTNFKEGNGIDDMRLADRLASWLDEDTKQHFFSMLWTVQGHYPYFFSKDEEDFGVSNYNFNRYLNCLKHDDDLIGKVMHALEERGLASTTLVIVTGDHGEAFGQHHQYGHATAIYEENLKVPLYFINSTLFHGEHKKDIAGMKDLATTALSIIDVEIPQKWQGRDLLRTNSNEAFFFAPWSDYLFGYRKDNMKFIFNETRNTVEVYDLSSDSNENSNLFQPRMKEEVANARNRVAAWVQYQDKFIKRLWEKNK